MFVRFATKWLVAPGTNPKQSWLADADIDAEIDTYSHTLRLRDDFEVEIQLPTDLTVREAERLAAFVSSLPMEE